MSPSSPRRRLLHGLGAAALLGRIGRATAAEPVRWRDIELLDGRLLRARELEGHPVVVEIWASWCPFCAKQNPLLQQLHEATRGSNLRVLTFSIDRNKEDAVKYLRKHGYTFAAAMATPQVERWFGKRRSLPELYVVDASGQVVQREQGEMFPEDVAALARYASASR